MSLLAELGMGWHISDQKSVTQVSMPKFSVQSKVKRNFIQIYRWTLAYTISDILQHEVDDFVQQWNTHTIRQSRADCIGGIPEDLYDMPQNYGRHFLENCMQFCLFEPTL